MLLFNVKIYEILKDYFKKEKVVDRINLSRIFF